MSHLINSIQVVGWRGNSFIRDIERTIKIIFVSSQPNITKTYIKEYTININRQRSNRDIDRNRLRSNSRYLIKGLTLLNIFCSYISNSNIDIKLYKGYQQSLY